MVNKIMERLIRIELTLVAWKATVLPLNYRRVSGIMRRDMDNYQA